MSYDVIRCHHLLALYCVISITKIVLILRNEQTSVVCDVLSSYSTGASSTSYFTEKRVVM